MTSSVLGGIVRRLSDPRRRAAVASTAVLAVASTGLVALAVSSDGYAAAEVDIHDGGVWVTNRSSSSLGEVNPVIRQPVMAAYVEPAVTDVDVVQDGSLVLAVVGGEKPVLRRVDTTAAAFAPQPVELPPRARVAVGGGVLAVVDGDRGRLWVADRETLPALRFDGSVDPVAELGAGAAVTVSADGTVHAASPASGVMVRLPRAARSTPSVEGVAAAAVERTSPDGLRGARSVEATVVGGVPVLLVDNDRVLMPGRDPVSLPESDEKARLQQASADGPAAFVATSRALYRVPLSGGPAVPVTTKGTLEPAAPVQVAGCAYAVWSGTPTLATSCGDADPVLSAIGGADTARGGSYVLRLNRGRVVVNDADHGDVYLVDDVRTKLPDFTAIAKKVSADRSVASDTQQETSTSNRDKDNRKPDPADDDLGARAGLARLLPVLANDSDPDGDVLTVIEVAVLPKDFGELRIVEQGRRVEFVPARQAAGERTVRYTVSDGRTGGTAQAGLRLRIVPQGQNQAPAKPRTTPVVSVRAAGTVSYGVLEDWSDPDGDPLTLTCDSDPAISCTPDGALTVQGPAKTGERQVEVVVSDPQQRTLGQVIVRVVEAGSQNPLARPDHATGVVGVPVRITPLENDTGYGKGRLRLSAVSGDGTAAVRTLGEDAIEFSGKTAGTSYVSYTAVDGDRAATSVIRVDVARAGGNQAPVPAPDRAVVRGVEPVDVDVLANDSDPDGDVLVVAAVGPVEDDAGGTGSVATVVGHRFVRIVPDAAASQEAQTFQYTVSDGRTERQATVTVRPMAITTERAPVAHDDRAVVRAGNPLAVAVLENDVDPQGGRLSLAPTVSDVSFRPSAGKAGTPPLAYGAGEAIRLLAPDVPGTLSLTYTALNGAGVPASANLTVQVIAIDAPNTAPQPSPIDARAIAGQRVVIPVPSSGMDPDGDAVSLRTPPTQPALGVVELDPTRPDALVYTPRQDARGTDSFTYTVADAAGLTGTATIRIGVAALPAIAAPPVAVHDAIRVRNTPSRRLRAAVLGNDSSPGGAPITLAEQDPVTVMTAGSEVSVSGQALEVVVPQGATAPIRAAYRIESGGLPGAAAGILTVTPDPAAPLLPPSARDDVVRPLTANSVELTPLVNDTDPDGSPADLSLTEAGTGGATTVGPADLLTRLDARRLKVTPGSVDRWGWYSVTDLDGKQAIGLVFVQGTVGPPHLRVGMAPFTVQKGQSKVLSLASYIEAPSGRPVRLTTAQAVSASGVSALAKSANSLTVTGDVAGRGAVTVEVIDSETVNDAKAARATVSIPVTVTAPPEENRPPTFTAQTMTVRRGKTATLNLERATTDDARDSGRHTFSVKGSPTLTGVSAKVTGGRLDVTATTSAELDSTAVTLTVSDGKNRAVLGTVTVTVTETDLPKPLAADCGPAADAVVRPGTTLTVDLTSCTENPDPKTPLQVRLGPLPGETGTASSSGTRIQVQINQGFNGTLLLPYTVIDGFGRTASALITARVMGLPGKPGVPEVVGQPGNATVALRWTAATSNGSDVDKYTITATGVSQDCPGTVTQCQVSGLENGTSYTFTVTAHNEAGEGPASGPSAPIMPNTRPEAPTGLAATPQNASAVLTFTTRSTGSAIRQDVVTVTSPEGTRTVEFANGTKGGTVSRTVPGLTNGVSYGFSVVSENEAGVSDATATGPVVPSGPASAPPAPTVTETGGAVGGQLTVSWNPAAVRAAANGLLTRLMIEDTSGGVPARDVTSSADSGSAVFDVQMNGTYTFRLTVTNNGGSSASSGGTRATAEGTPATPVWSGSPTASDGAAQVAFTNVVANGVAVKSVTVTGGPNSVSVPVGGPYSATIGGLSNGTSYRFTVRVCNTSDRCTSSAQSAAVVPFGPAYPPNISASVNGRQVTFTWGATDTGGYAGTQVQIGTVGPGVICPQPTFGADSCTFQGEYSGDYSFWFSARNPAGGKTVSTDTVRTADPPPPPPSNLTFSFTENPFLCNGGSRSMGRLYGAQAGERITFTSPTVGGLLPGTANSSGELGLIWQCQPGEAGNSWTVTARGSTSGRTGVFTVTGR